MIGEWLNEKTMTGIASHNVSSNLLTLMPSLAWARKAPFQFGIRLRASSNSEATKG